MTLKSTSENLAAREASPQAIRSYLPDLCGVRPLVATLLVAQLLAFVLTLAPSARWADQGFWHGLGLVSLFVHWVALTSLMCLCLARKRLARIKPVHTAWISFTLVLLITFSASLLVAIYGRGILVDARQSAPVFAIKNTIIAAIVAALALRVLYLHHVQKQTNEARSSARVQALQARIRPHFLFNSMNTIAALIHKDPAQAELAVEDLAELFRSSLLEEGKLVTLADELETVKKYLHIESHRLGDRLQVQWLIESIPADAYLPPLVLQPLFENAVYYGIEPAAQGGCIRVQVKQNDQFVELIIENPNHVAMAAKKGKGHQIALDNIKERLKFYFGKHGQLYLVEQAQTMRVILSFPLGGQQGHSLV